ncbi:hypothetical protein ANN_14698 [Periplaneta americana]|uniref:DUF4817 domain-containing protein n=1 Tax=Periplaneta americana TaxID=6978 RepID=A0ABQ8SX08_PERAM|nr:hypothetical protein ANN_14698 [Periplaneta americana]
MQYTLNQRLFLVKQYWITNSITATQRAYQREFGVRNPPKTKHNTGTGKQIGNNWISSTTGAVTQKIIKTFVAGDRVHLLNVSESLKRYRVTVVHQLQEPDKDKRLNYCRWFQTFIVQNPAILSITWNLWPPRSPDLTTPDFFLWGYLIERVYTTRPQTLDDLKHPHRRFKLLTTESSNEWPVTWNDVLSCALCRMEDIFNICYRALEYMMQVVIYQVLDNRLTFLESVIICDESTLHQKPQRNRPHIDVSLTCEHDPKLQEYCVCPQNMPQFDSEGIPNQAPETNKPVVLNDPTSRNREGSDQETFDPCTGEPYD